MSKMTLSLKSCDRVCDRLHLGDKNAACDLDLLARLKVTHVLTAELIPLPHIVTSAFPNLAVMHLQIADVSDADLLTSLEKCVRFIRQGIESSSVNGGGSGGSSNGGTNVDPGGGGGGSVLVHCYHGISRSAAVVAAYLMKTRRLSYEEALSLIQQRRPQACPNSGFAQQLRLYRLMGWRLDASSPAFKCYRLKCVQDTIKRTKILPTEVRRFRDNVSLMEAATAPDHHHQQQQSSSSSNGDDPLAEVVAALRLSEGAGAGGEAASTPDEDETAAVRGQSKCNGVSNGASNGDSGGSCGGSSGDVPFAATRSNGTAAAGHPAMQSSKPPLPKAAEVMKVSRKLYRCKKCRQILATQAGVLPHSPSAKTVTWTGLMESEEERKWKPSPEQQQQRGGGQTTSECRQGVFVEPARWMEHAFLSVSGRLCCQRCSSKLGHFSWNGEVRCACGCVASPGFVVNLGRVDVCTMLKDVADASL